MGRKKKLSVLLTFRRELPSQKRNGDLAKGWELLYWALDGGREYFSRKGKIIKFYELERSMFTNAIKHKIYEGLSCKWSKDNKSLLVKCQLFYKDVINVHMTFVLHLNLLCELSEGAGCILSKVGVIHH